MEEELRKKKAVGVKPLNLEVEQAEGLTIEEEVTGGETEPPKSMEVVSGAEDGGTGDQPRVEQVAKLAGLTFSGDNNNGLSLVNVEQ